MNIEDEMYRVMAALSAGDVPVDFKGAMVLHAFLYPAVTLKDIFSA